MQDNKIAVHGEVAVSVIVTAHNAQKNLPRCLHALRDQSLRIYADMEAIVVDCGSGDRTHELALEFRRENPDFVRVHRHSGTGRAAAQDAGLALARGKYAVFCDAGDIMPPDMVRALYEACEETGSQYAGSGGAKIWDRTLRGMLVRRDFLLAHGLPGKPGHDRAEQLAAYDTLRRLLGPEDLPLFCTHWVRTLRGICLAAYRESNSSAAFYRRMISLADSPQAMEAMAEANRDGLDRALKKFCSAFAARDWIAVERQMRKLGFKYKIPDIGRR